MNHPMFIVSNQMEEFISKQRLNTGFNFVNPFHHKSVLGNFDFKSLTAENTAGHFTKLWQ